MRRPVVHVHALCWNEARILPYFFRHYDVLDAEYFILDDSSTDRSPELLDAHPRVTWERYTRAGDSFVIQAQGIYNEMWKASRGRADWVIVCNIDEHFWHPDLGGHLAAATRAGYTILPSKGYQMVTLWHPRRDKRLADTSRRGTPWDKMSKTAVFNPDAIDEINFTPGRHVSDPIGDVVAPAAATLALLHYKLLGVMYLMQRSRELSTGMRPGDVERGAGMRYFFPPNRMARDYLYFLRMSSWVPAPPYPRAST